MMVDAWHARDAFYIAAASLDVVLVPVSEERTLRAVIARAALAGDGACAIPSVCEGAVRARIDQEGWA